MKSQAALAAHPRLYIGAREIARLQRTFRLPFLRAAATRVRENAAKYAMLAPLEYRRDTHNEHLLRAREMQQRVVTLLARWAQTRDERLRRAVLKHVELMRDWEHWSWIAWRGGVAAPDAIFDLSYGENSATLAIAYDWLYASLSRAEKKLLLDTARMWSFAAGLKHARAGGAGWFGQKASNWNAVCSGGLGMLALAMYEDAAEARRLLPRCAASLAPFMEGLDDTGGGWPEGIGYWNYGMRYAFMYLMSHRNATGRFHPLLRRPATRQTLRFPLDFCPNDQPCGFGDNNNWTPLPFHYAAAQALRCRKVRDDLDARLARMDAKPIFEAGLWPNAAEWLLLHPGKSSGRRPPAGRAVTIVKRCPGLDWVLLADRLPEPRLYVAARGGTTKVSHGQRDLMSFQCLVGGEPMIVNLGLDEYLDTTFSGRREELFEIVPASKNTILINGVGIVPQSCLNSTSLVRMAAGKGVRFDATSAMGRVFDGHACEFCGRLILLLDGGILIVDRAMLPHVGRMECRMHTFCGIQPCGTDGALLRGKRERLRLACAANVPAALVTARTAPTTPTAPPAGVLRWCTQAQHKDITLATLLTPDARPARLVVQDAADRIAIAVYFARSVVSIVLTPRLHSGYNKSSSEG